jgi:hypothetical protein
MQARRLSDDLSDLSSTPARRAPRSARRARLNGDDDPDTVRLHSSAAFARHRRSQSGSIFRPRLGLVGIAFLLTLSWFVFNLRRPAPLDVLPFIWMWLTLWLALSVAVDLYGRFSRATRPRRRSRL